MEKLIRNTGLHHLADHIFGFVDNYSLAQCMLVCKEWNNFLSRSILVRHFDKLLTLKYYRLNQIEKTFDYLYLTEDWHEAAHYFRQVCHLDDLKEVIRVLGEWFNKSSQLLFLTGSGSYFWDPLEYAASKGYEEFFSAILKSSINLNQPGPNGPIFNACYYAQINIIKLLLDAKENGTNLDIYGEYSPQKKTSVLVEAVRSCNLGTIQLLLERSKSIGLDINYNLGTQDEAFSVLYVACNGRIPNSREIVTLILDFAKANGIKLNVFPRFLHKVTSYTTTAVLMLLLERYDELDLDINERDLFGRTVVAEACSLDTYEKLLLLINFANRRDIDINVPDLNGNDILQYALLHGNASIVKTVLEYADKIPIDINHKNHQGETTLFLATKSSSGKLKLFLDYAQEKHIQLQVHGYNNLNQSILQAKIVSGCRYLKDVDIANTLIARREEIGFNLNHKDDNGKTAADLLALNHLELVGENVMMFVQNIDPTREGSRRKRCNIL